MAKIIFLVTQSEMGGAQKYIYEVAKVLAERHVILVAAGDPAFAEASAGKGELFQKLKNTPVKPVHLKQMKRAPNPIRIICAITEIIQLLKSEKPDVLFLCSTTAGLLGSVAAKLYKLKIVNCKLKIIYRIGGWAFNDPRPFWKNWLIFLAEKLTANFKDLIIVNSGYDRQIAIKKKITPPEKIVKIYNGLDAESLNFLSKEEAKGSLKLSFNEPLIGCIANFYKTKGLEYLIKSILNLKSQISNLVCVIIGEGGERPKLEALIKKYSLEDKVILTGRIPDAYKYLKAFDLFALPSLKEGFPWVILEAAAAGIPIVATKVGAIPEILPEEFLVEPANAEALAKKIRQMLEHPATPKLKQEFSLQKMVEQTEKLLP